MLLDRSFSFPLSLFVDQVKVSLFDFLLTPSILILHQLPKFDDTTSRLSFGIDLHFHHLLSKCESNFVFDFILFLGWITQIELFVEPFCKCLRLSHQLTSLDDIRSVIELELDVIKWLTISLTLDTNQKCLFLHRLLPMNDAYWFGHLLCTLSLPDESTIEEWISFY